MLSSRGRLAFSVPVHVSGRVLEFVDDDQKASVVQLGVAVRSAGGRLPHDVEPEISLLLAHDEIGVLRHLPEIAGQTVFLDLVQRQRVPDRGRVPLQKRYELGCERAVKIRCQFGQPDSFFPDADIKRDYPPVFGPETVENALDDRCLAAFATGEQCPGFGRASRNPADPFVQKREFLFPSHQKVGIADNFGQRVLHGPDSFLRTVRVLSRSRGSPDRDHWNHITARLFDPSKFGGRALLSNRPRKSLTAL